MAPGVRRGGPDHPRLLLGPGHERHRLGRGPRPVPPARRTGRLPRRVRGSAARGPRRTRHLPRLCHRRPPQRGPAPLPALAGPARRGSGAPGRRLDPAADPARRLLGLQGPLTAGRYGHPRGRGPHPCRRPPGRPRHGPLPAAGRRRRYDGGADLHPRRGHRTAPPGRRRPAGRRPAAALPALGGQTPGRGTGVERRQVRLSAHPRHGRLGLGPVQPRSAHGGVPARADRGCARQRGRPHQRAGHREADPDDPGLGPDAGRPAGVVHLERAPGPGGGAGRRGDLLRRRHDHGRVQTPRAGPGGGAAHLGRGRRHDRPPPPRRRHRHHRAHERRLVRRLRLVHREPRRHPGPGDPAHPPGLGRGPPRPDGRRDPTRPETPRIRPGRRPPGLLGRPEPLPPEAAAEEDLKAPRKGRGELRDQPRRTHTRTHNGAIPKPSAGRPPQRRAPHIPGQGRAPRLRVVVVVHPVLHLRVVDVLTTAVGLPLRALLTTLAALGLARLAGLTGALTRLVHLALALLLPLALVLVLLVLRTHVGSLLW
ncbi:hypothetical protein GPN2_11015 [Streptomyces murinus]